jgi:hypothetical protein
MSLVTDDEASEVQLVGVVSIVTNQVLGASGTTISTSVESTSFTS